MVIVVGYLYYDNIIVPQKQIIKLEKQIVEEKKKPSLVVEYINKKDANRTQEEINEIKTREADDIGDSGIITFRGVH
jgi:hypothetical protein